MRDLTWLFLRVLACAVCLTAPGRGRWDDFTRSVLCLMLSIIYMQPDVVAFPALTGSG
jgi:hypothetical protein